MIEVDKLTIDGEEFELTGYAKKTDLNVLATETYVKNYAQPKGDYATKEDLENVEVENPNATAVDMVRNGNTITATVSLDNGNTSTSVITLDANDKPIKIVTDGAECPISWAGFGGGDS